MKPSLMFGKLLCSTYAASESTEPIERYYASMFASYFEKTDSQPGSAAVHAIVRGDRAFSRKLLHHYRDPGCSRCPPSLVEDLTSMVDCFFSDAVRCCALRHTLGKFLTEIPVADAEDIGHILDKADLVQMWTCLTWYAICCDHHGTSSY